MKFQFSAEPDERDVDPFAEYYAVSEPDAAGRVYAWQTAIGLQDVDRLNPSEYLLRTAKDNIEGNITLEDARRLIDDYYVENEDHLPESTEEADKVSVRIAELLSEPSFVLSPAQYLSIHKRLFTGIYSHAGTMRDYNISKKEWVLNGESVMYGGAWELSAALEYDINKEKDFRYSLLTVDEIISHLAKFIADLWQIHVFEEGNTRTTAVFLIKYLRKMGFDITNDSFAHHSWYFRNSLVRANYTNLSKGIHSDNKFLEQFLRNLLLGEHNELKNRYLHVDWQISHNSAGDSEVKQDFKQDFKRALVSSLETSEISAKSRSNILKLGDKYGNDVIFNRTMVMDTLSITSSPASVLIKKMKQLDLLEEIKGAGNGMYRFRNPQKR